VLKPKKKSDRVAWFEFRDGIEVALRYVSEHRFGQLGEKATISKWKDHQIVKDRDEDKYYEMCAAEMIADWRGLNGAALKTLVDLEEYPADDAEVPYSADDAFVLLRHSAEFDVFVTRNCKALERFLATEETARKNVSSLSLVTSLNRSGEARGENSLAASA
jgi:hypothetical protein